MGSPSRYDDSGRKLLHRRHTSDSKSDTEAQDSPLLSECSSVDEHYYRASVETERKPRSRRTTAGLGWKKWLLILSAVFGGLLVIISGGGIWVYESAPPDGQSPPWYPTRKSRNVDAGRAAVTDSID